MSLYIVVSPSKQLRASVCAPVVARKQCLLTEEIMWNVIKLEFINLRENVHTAPMSFKLLESICLKLPQNN